MKIIANLCPYWSYPPTAGGPIRVHHLNKSLSDKFKILQFSARPTFGHQQLGLSNWIGSRTIQITENYLEHQYFHPLILASSYYLYKIGVHSDIFLSQLLRLVSPKVLCDMVKQASIIQVEHPWMFDIASQLAEGKPIIFVAHNVEADLWGSATNNGNPLIPSLSLIPGELEKEALWNATAIIGMSQNDIMRMQSNYGLESNQVHIIPNGVDLDSKSVPSSEEKSLARKVLKLDERPVVLFTGSDHYPNKMALSLIQAWNESKALPPDIQFVIIGTVGRRDQTNSNVRIEGYVPDATNYLRAADLAINPITIGSGTSLKVIEFLACGLPTISTEIGIRGLDLNPSQDILIGDISEFPALISRLLKDPEKMENFSINGRNTVAKKYGWDRLGNRMQEVYRRLS